MVKMWCFTRNLLGMMSYPLHWTTTITVTVLILSIQRSLGLQGRTFIKVVVAYLSILLCKFSAVV